MDNDMEIAKISAMFPTVPEARIRELLKKWGKYYRLQLQNIYIYIYSALQNKICLFLHAASH